MKVVHRVGLRATASQRRELEDLGAKLPAGVVLPGGGDPLLAFDIDESHPNWPTLSTLFRRWNVSDVLRTEFSKKEIETASWLDLVADWHHGYPQPDEDVFGYRQATYDLTDWCEECGVGMKQRAPFQMKGEPKWGKNVILQLNWVFDEFFVTPEIWSSIFKPFRIGCRPVTSTKGVELRTVVQLVIEEEVGIVTEGLSSKRCGKCGVVKYLPVTRGPFPALKEKPSQAVAKTREYFGSGGRAHKHVLVSQELARALARERVRGASLTPVGSVIDRQ
jgi:hypothetical protein